MAVSGSRIHDGHLPNMSVRKRNTPMPPDADIVAPALLQLNRGSAIERRTSTSYEPCPTDCGISPKSISNCSECLDSGFSSGCNPHCDTCWADCASPCEDDDCDIPQPCYDEHCATDTCLDNKCTVDPCHDATCAETVHCNTTCFNSSCTYPLDDVQYTASDAQLCGEGQCYGFLPGASGLQGFHQSPDMLCQCPQTMLQQNMGFWNHLTDSCHSHDHITGNHHKRRRLEGSDLGETSQFSNSYHAHVGFQSWQPSYGHGYGNSNFISQPHQEQFNADGDQSWLTDDLDDFLHPLAAHQPLSTSRYEPNPTNHSNENEVIEGLACELSHVSASGGSIHPSMLEHSPFCSQVNSNRSSPKPNASTFMTNMRHSGLLNSSSASTFQDSPLKRSLDSFQPGAGNVDAGVIDGRSARGPTLTLPPTSSSEIDSTEEEIKHTCKWVVSPAGVPHQVVICGHTFTSSKELDEHLQKEHTGKLGTHQFTCLWEDCNTAFKHRGKLNRHIAGSHSRYHAYHCSHCERTFCTKEQLKNHETTHTGEKKYKCRFCDHTSATKTQHNTHERTHTKEKPYGCPYCPHRSGDSSNLSKHIKNKHPGLKKLPADESGRS